MNPAIYTVIIVASLIAFAVYIGKKIAELKESQKPSDELLGYLKTTNDRLNEQSRNFNDRLDNAARIISQVQKNIGEFSEIGRGMKDLQVFLNSPKLRGNLGEHILKELLGQFLPSESFSLQYAFKSGEKVDAAIKTSGGIIPVDSKFPLENFRKLSSAETEIDKKSATKDFEKDVRRHVDDIARKYILTDEGTIDYALMYVPSEVVYYEIVNNADLFDYAGERRVLPVSPTTFYAYLKAILMSFEGQKIEAQAKMILTSLRSIKSDYGKVEENLSVLNKHLTNAFNMMGNVFSAFSQLGLKISSTQNLGTSVKKEIKELESEV
jgi:DNA recombination protein RmuC